MFFQKIKLIKNRFKSDSPEASGFLSKDETEKALAFLSTFPGYVPTPLVRLASLAKRCNLGGIFVKDESKRFGLNAFKAMGAGYAIARYAAKKIGRDISTLDYNTIVSDEVKRALGGVTFYTATDGNHGRAVAWAAARLGQKSVVFMPEGSSAERLGNIQKEGADASITKLNYDNAVRLAASRAAADKNGVVVQDTAWAGYEEIPKWIMQGYGALAMEADRQVKEVGVKPTHVFVQAGVGSFAAAVQGYLREVYKKEAPIVTVVEASAADCIYRSAERGERVSVGGKLKTIMAGLACGESNTIAWEILKNQSDFFLSIPDDVSRLGMRTLGKPLEGDERIISGESGAAGAGALAAIMTEKKYTALRRKLQLGQDSVVLLFSTEGNTDSENYKRIVGI